MTIVDDRPPVPLPRPIGRPARADAAGALPRPELLVGIGAIAWLWSLQRIDIDAVGPDGLLAVLPWQFFLAIAAPLGGFIVASVRPRNAHSERDLGSAVLLTCVVLHGTVAVLRDVPRYSWVFKHYGVTDYIAKNGHVDLEVDIYHNYPGFFAGAADLLHAAGIDGPNALARWTPFVFTVLVAVAVRYVADAFLEVGPTRWIPSLVFLLFYWDYNVYFAPQAPALVLALCIVGTLLHRYCEPTRLRRTSGAVARRRPGPADHVLVLLAFAAIVVSHQITPFLVLAMVGVLAIFADLRPRWLVLGMLAIVGGYTALRYPFLRDHFDLVGTPGASNVITPGVRADPSPAIARNIAVRGSLALSLVLLAAAGALRSARNRQRFLVPAACVASVSAVVVIQPYGGEAILRAYLFSVPFLGILAAPVLAAAVGGVGGRRRTLRMAAGLTLTFATTISWFVGFYGLDYQNTITSDELVASQYLYEATPEGSVIVALAGPSGTGNFPWRSAAGYTRRGRTSYWPDELFTGAPLSPADYVDGLTRELATQRGRRYVVLSQGMLRRQEMYGQSWYGGAEYDEVFDLLRSNPDYQLEFDSPTAWVFSFIPPDGVG